MNNQRNQEHKSLHGNQNASQRHRGPASGLRADGPAPQDATARGYYQATSHGDYLIRVKDSYDIAPRTELDRQISVIEFAPPGKQQFSQVVNGIIETAELNEVVGGQQGKMLDAASGLRLFLVYWGWRANGGTFSSCSGRLRTTSGKSGTGLVQQTLVADLRETENLLS